MAYLKTRFGRRRFDPIDPLADDDQVQPEEELDGLDEDQEDEDREDALNGPDEMTGGLGADEEQDRDEPDRQWAGLAPEMPEIPAPATPQSFSELAKQHEKNIPQLKPPSKLRRVLAGVSAGAMGFGGTPSREIQRNVQGVLHPGYEREMANWRERGKALSRGAEIEMQQSEEKRRTAQHEAALEFHRASTAGAKARESYYNRRAAMPPNPRVPTTYESYLTGKMVNGTTEEKADAEQKLQDLKAKGSPDAKLIVKEFFTRDGAILRFYDPVTGEMARPEERIPGVIRPPSTENAGAAETRRDKEETRKLDKQANALAGQAQRAAGDDAAGARQWLLENVPDDELRALALRKIGRPPAEKNKNLKILGDWVGAGKSSPFGGGSNKPTGKSTNPYRR